MFFIWGGRNLPPQALTKFSKARPYRVKVQVVIRDEDNIRLGSSILSRIAHLSDDHDGADMLDSFRNSLSDSEGLMIKSLLFQSLDILDFKSEEKKLFILFPFQVQDVANFHFNKGFTTLVMEPPRLEHA